MDNAHTTTVEEVYSWFKVNESPGLSPGALLRGRCAGEAAMLAGSCLHKGRLAMMDGWMDGCVCACTPVTLTDPQSCLLRR